jgi:type I restriction-modification system DNA methylase subunit
VRSLKPSKKAFFIVPEGILNRVHGNNLRAFIRDECVVDGIISLPVNTFYRNPQKTYVLAITKKTQDTEIERRADTQTDPVFTYLVSNIGETLDVKRFSIPENDLDEMTALFNQFKGAKKSFRTDNKRCKIQPISLFDPDAYWSVDRWWTRDEKITLGIEEPEVVVTLDEFKERAATIAESIRKLNEELADL